MSNGEGAPSYPFPLPGFPIWWPPGFEPAPVTPTYRPPEEPPAPAALPTVPVTPTPTPIPTPTAPPPISPPVATPTPGPGSRPVYGPASGGTSAESYRGMAERAMRDTAKRKAAQRTGERIIEGEILRRGAGAIGRGILGPIGGVIWGIISPGKLGTGEATPEDLAESMRRRRERDETEETILGEILRDVFRGSAIAGAGITIGGGVIISEIGRLGRLPMPLPDPRADERVTVEVPRVEIPAPSIPQPSPLPLPSPVPTIPKPLPTPPTRSSSPPTTRSSSPPTTRTIPRSIPAPAPTTSPWPKVAQQLGNLLSQRRSAWTVPRTAALNRPGEAIATQPLPSVSPSFVDPLTMPQTPTSPLTSPLTRVQPQVLGSSPPRLRTRQRTRECECEPKKRKPKRECRASATVVWAGGPNKGKIAGRRCYSFVGGK